MNVLSVCSGIGTPELAWKHLGWNYVAMCEIEKHPRRVLKSKLHAVDQRRYLASGQGRPMLWGDFTTLRPRHIRKTHGPIAIDLLVGGTPCQSFSVAGERAGLDDPRGNLTLEFARLAKRFRPRWLVWENVPGVLSIDGGRTFGTFLGLLGKLGYGFAYRILDAQYFGVPQRRRRVFLIGHLGDWKRAAAVLSESHSLSGNSAPRREARQNVAGTISSRTQGGGGLGTDFDLAGGVIPVGGIFDDYISPALSASGRGISRTGESRGQDCLIAGDVSHPINAGYGERGYGVDETYVAGVVSSLDANFGRLQGCSRQDANHGHSHLVAFGGNNTSGPIEVASACNAKGGAGRMGFESETLVAHSLRGGGFDASEDGTGRGTPIIPVSVEDWVDSYVYCAQCGKYASSTFCNCEDAESKWTEESHYGTAMLAAHPPAIAFTAKDYGADAEEDLSPTLRSGGHTKSHANAGVMPAIANNFAVRRLTPTECERLQGLPDNHTLVSPNDADGPRYKAIGNGMALPVLRWIGERIQMVEDICR